MLDTHHLLLYKFTITLTGVWKMMNTKNNKMPADVNMKLEGDGVVKYKNRIYSAKWLNDTHGYFLIPINSSDAGLGFWAPLEKCTCLKN